MSLFDDVDEKFEAAYNKALSLLDYSPQTCWMIETKLLKKGFTKETVKKVVKKLESNEIVNDRQYAEIYAENLTRAKYNGPNLILVKLKEKGINDKIARDIIKEFCDAEVEKETAKGFIIKNKAGIKRLIESGRFDKIRLKLMTNGFNAAAVNIILKNINEILETD